MIKVNKLSKSFKTSAETVKALEDVSFSIKEGSVASIVGRSGSGKTTLLGLMGGLDKPTTGTILVDNNDITKMNDSMLIKYRSSKIGFVFQNYNLIPNLSALENVMLPLEFNHIESSKRKDLAREALLSVGLDENQINRKPSRLSGGQQQRVAIARAIVNNPKLVLADEPTGNLDAQTAKVIFKLLKDLAKSQNTTIIVVTHDLEIAKNSDITFNISDGKLKKGKP